MGGVGESRRAGDQARLGVGDSRAVGGRARRPDQPGGGPTNQAEARPTRRRLFLNSTCLWLKDFSPSGDKELHLPARVDVAVIGGGYTGVAAARALAQEGASVAVLEQHEMGWGASTRNGGFVLPGFKRDVAALARRLGEAKARALFDVSLRSLDFLEELIAQCNIDCGYRRSGNISLAESDRQVRGLVAEQRLLSRAFGYETTMLGAAALREEIESRRYCGGLLDPRAGSLHPAKLFHGLARAAAAAGAAMIPHLEARAIRYKPGGVTIATSGGELSARDVLLATNGYSGRVHPGLRRRIVPLGSHIIATAPLALELIRRIMPQRRTMIDSRNLLHYFRLSEDDRMLFGGRASFSPAPGNHSPAAARILARDMTAIFPDLTGIPIDFAWSGNVAVTLDQMPHAGRMGGAAYAAGYCGHGVAMSVYVGDRMGRYLAGRAGLPPLAELDFPFFPLYNGRPWFLPIAGAWYRLTDWLNST